MTLHDITSHHINHITPLLRELHWLKVPERTHFPVCADIPTRTRYNAALSRRKLPLDHRYHRPLPSAVRRQFDAYRATYSTIVSLAVVLFLLLHLTIKYKYMRWFQCQFHRIHDFNVDFIHIRGIVLLLPNLSELKKAIVFLHKAMSTLAEAVHSYTDDHANLLGCLSHKESLPFIVNDFCTLNPRQPTRIDECHY